MTNPSKRYKNRPIFSAKDIELMLEKADLIGEEYRRLRVKAVISLFKKFGKRRSELARLQFIDLIVEDNSLIIEWTISKKHKKGLFQFIKFVKIQMKKGKLPANYLDNKTYLQLNSEWKDWTQTKDGFKIKEEKRTKKLSIEDRYCKLVLEYLEYMKKNYPDAKFLFPSNTYSFGNLMMVSPDYPLSGRQLLRLIKPLDKRGWCHLFRETKGAEIAREYGNDIAGIAKVRETLDLEKEETAYIYTRRYAIQEIKPEL